MSTARYLADRVRRAIPDGAPVVPGSTPVLSFGNPTTCDVATLGINPSRIEFQTSARAELPDGSKRLEDLDSLVATSTVDLTDSQVVQVADACHRYFKVNPYRRWFDKLNTVLDGIDKDYYTGTACHLDLVQWATDPVWGKFPKGLRTVRQSMLEADRGFLAQQIETEDIKLVLVNGRTVANWLQRSGIVRLEHAGDTPLGKRGKRSELLRGEALGAAFLGWTLNVSHSQTTDSNRNALAGWLAATWSG